MTEAEGRKSEKFNVEGELMKFTSTLVMMMTICSVAHAKAKEEKNGEGNKNKTELKANVAHSSVAALNINCVTIDGKKGTEPSLFIKSIPSVSISAEKNGFFGKADLGQIVTLECPNGDGKIDFSTLNKTAMVELGKQFGNGAKLSLVAGRDAPEAKSNFSNGVPVANYETSSSSFITFSSRAGRVLVRLEKDGKVMELGFADEAKVVPNPMLSQLYGKIGTSFEKNGVRVNLVAAAQLSQGNNKILGSTAVVFPFGDGQMGIAAGGNASINNKQWNAYVREAYTSYNTGMSYIIEAAKKKGEFSVNFGLGRQGLQVFGKVAINPTSKVIEKSPAISATKKVTGGFGLSYAFKGNKTFGKGQNNCYRKQPRER